MVVAETITVVVVPVVRSVIGWLEKAVSDKSDGASKITSFEMKKLLETLVRVSFLQVAIFLGLGAFGIDAPMLAASASALVLDMLFKALKKK